MMQSPDLEVLKDIPGYKAILKAVLRSQIQLLVEQLADHTGEESVLLTANVADGSLCHLGSESGKDFLEGHEEIKSQFLGFCLKRQHKRKAESSKRRVPEYPGPPVTGRSSVPAAGTASKRPRTSEPTSALQTLTPTHPVAFSKAGRPPRPSPTGIRTQSPSHTQSAAESPLSTEETGIKQEVLDNLEMQGQDSETSNQMAQEESGDQQTSIVKLEPVGEGELDLEITGVEMGESSVSGQMSYGQADWSIGQSGDGSLGGMEGYDSGSQSEFGNSSTEKPSSEDPADALTGWHVCETCGKKFPWKAHLTRHQRTHTGEKPYKCELCDKSFSQKFNLKAHYLMHMEKDTSLADDASNETLGKLLAEAHTYKGIGTIVDVGNQKAYHCFHCEKVFYSGSCLKRHSRTHTGEKPFECQICGKKFSQKGNMENHHRLMHSNRDGSKDTNRDTDKDVNEPDGEGEN